MPQSNRRVSTVNIREDMCNYYHNSVATYLKPLSGGGYERIACRIESYEGDHTELFACIQLLRPEDNQWGASINVPNEAMCYELPELGTVRLGQHDWIHLIRHPQRRMRKGYNEENVQWVHLEDVSMRSSECSVMNRQVIKQIWYGCPERLHTNVVLEGKGIYFKAEKVATVSDDGVILFIPNKEKLGEFVCKLLANNWEDVKSKHPLLTLPS